MYIFVFWFKIYFGGRNRVFCGWHFKSVVETFIALSANSAHKKNLEKVFLIFVFEYFTDQMFK